MAKTTGKRASYFISTDVTAALKEWYKDLHNSRSGERAELRRCSSPAEVAFSPAYVRLLRSIQKAGLHSRDTDLRIASIAGLLAHLRPNDQSPITPEEQPETELEAEEEVELSDDTNDKSDDGTGVGIQRFGQVLGANTSNKALLSGLRFRRLLQTQNPEERYRLMIRVLRLIQQQKYKVSPISLALTIYWWERDNTRQQLAFGYYKVAPANTP